MTANTASLASIVERFSMEIVPPADGEGEWFLDWVLRSPKGASQHLTSSWYAMESLKSAYPTQWRPSRSNFATIREYFGGMGAHALMADNLFFPEEHVVGEFSPEAVTHLERVLAPLNVDVRHWDAYQPGVVEPADLQVLDFGDLTVWKTRDGEQHRELLDLVFATEPKAVLVTDISARYLHLHRERYETLLGPGTCGSYETYLEALAARLQALYGYRLHRGFYDRWSTVMSFVPEEIPGEGYFTPTPEKPVGLELF